jgi:hypothetical protein
MSISLQLLHSSDIIVFHPYLWVIKYDESNDFSIIIMISIILYGYYNSNNFGDILFKYIFSDWLNKKKSNNLTFTIENPDTIENSLFTSTHILIGGGEIVNEYFMFPLIKCILSLIHI